MQAVLDKEGRILDMLIKCGGALSDLLGFEKSDLYWRLEAGFLANGLAIYSDNAYVNTNWHGNAFFGWCQVSLKELTIDNFFHSQLTGEMGIFDI